MNGRTKEKPDKRRNKENRRTAEEEREKPRRKGERNKSEIARL